MELFCFLKCFICSNLIYFFNLSNMLHKFLNIMFQLVFSNFQFIDLVLEPYYFFFLNRKVTITEFLQEQWRCVNILFSGKFQCFLLSSYLFHTISSISYLTSLPVVEHSPNANYSPFQNMLFYQLHFTLLNQEYNSKILLDAEFTHLRPVF